MPVISAVGHETDFTIADVVADLRAPTPSAAAEMVIATRQSLMERLDAGDSRLIQSVRLKLALSARRLHGVEIDAGRLHRTIGRRMQRVDEMEYRLREAARGAIQQRRRALEGLSARLRQRDVRLQLAEERRRLEEMRRRLGMLEQRVTQCVRLRLSRAAQTLAPLEAHLKQLSPVKILERGYAIVERAGRIVKSPADAPVGADVRVRLAEGEFGARVTKH
jgi:exodeoxyribonuclease VII large subunit